MLAMMSPSMGRSSRTLTESIYVEHAAHAHFVTKNFLRRQVSGWMSLPCAALTPVPGSDDTWATPQTVHTYFRNIQMWGGALPSNLTGSKVSAGIPTSGALRFLAPVMASLLGVASSLL